MGMPRCSACCNKTAPEDNWPKKMVMRTVTEDEAASNDYELALSDVAHTLDITTFMKQPFTETGKGEGVYKFMFLLDTLCEWPLMGPCSTQCLLFQQNLQ